MDWDEYWIWEAEEKEKKYLNLAENCSTKQKGGYMAQLKKARADAERMRKNLEAKQAWLKRPWRRGQ